MTDERFWKILDEFERQDEHGETYIPERFTKEVVNEIIKYDKTFNEAEADANLIWKGNVPDKAKKLIIEHYMCKKVVSEDE